jgi:hypothetical protein
MLPCILELLLLLLLHTQNCFVVGLETKTAAARPKKLSLFKFEYDST